MVRPPWRMALISRWMTALSFLVFPGTVERVVAADAPSSPQIPSEASSNPTRWFVRIGVGAGISQSSSTLYGQPVVGAMGVGPELPLLGRGASYSNLIFPSVQAGYFVAPNWSLEVAGGIPVWQTVRITGYSAVPPYDGTVLTRTLPGAVEITGAYHFTQFGAFQPYLGAGLAP